MVNLSQEQKTTVAALKAAKELFEETRGALDAQYADALEAAKANIRAAVKTARERGVPQRQIHLSLGFQQIAQLENFLRDRRLTVKDTNLDRIIKQEVPEAVATPLVGIDDSVPRFVQTYHSAISEGMGNFNEELHLNGVSYTYRGIIMNGDTLYIQEDQSGDPMEFPAEIKKLVIERYSELLDYVVEESNE